MLKKFISYYKPHKKLFFFDMLCAFLLAFCDLFYPTISGNIIDNYIPEGNIALLVRWSLVLLLIFVLKAVFTYILQYWGHCVGVRMQADMRRDVFIHMQKLPFKYFDSNKTGTIMSRIINDLMEISELAHHGPEDLFISIIMLIGSFTLLCFISLPLTLITFALVPVIVIFSSFMRRRMNASFKRTREEIADVNASLESSISGIRVSKAFTNSEHEREKFENNNKSFVKAREFAYRTMAEFSSGNAILTDVLTLVVLCCGGIFALKGLITIGSFVKYLLYVNMFLSPIKKLIGFIEQYQNGMTGFTRFIEILETTPEQDSPNAIDVQSVEGAISFDDVSFRYEDNKDVLTKISLDIKKGRTIAFVGTSGAGKTTLCHLLPRFYDITGGSIKIDGRDITDFTIDSLRRNIGIVQQDVFLFTGTIYDNIAYGNLNATEQEIIEASKLANIHDFVSGLENGYQTEIGERGVKLSGGQKQRLSIARLFLKNPPILILDEATSALDNATELLIQSALDQLSANKTTLVVAHRLSTIKNADAIVVLTDKGVEEIGSHDELIQKDGVYNALYKAQFKIDNQ